MMVWQSVVSSISGYSERLLLTEEASKALAETPEEKEFLMSKMLPMMIVGGFITVTITSVVIAGIFINLL